MVYCMYYAHQQNGWSFFLTIYEVVDGLLCSLHTRVTAADFRGQTTYTQCVSNRCSSRTARNTYLQVRAKWQARDSENCNISILQ